MYVGAPLLASEILEQPTLLDQVDDAYVVVIEDAGPAHRDVIEVMNMMHARGWDTVNITFLQSGLQGRLMVALLKNPRAKQKNMGDS